MYVGLRQVIFKFIHLLDKFKCHLTSLNVSSWVERMLLSLAVFLPPQSLAYACVCVRYFFFTSLAYLLLDLYYFNCFRLLIFFYFYFLSTSKVLAYQSTHNYLLTRKILCTYQLLLPQSHKLLLLRFVKVAVALLFSFFFVRRLVAKLPEKAYQQHLSGSGWKG